MKNQPGARTIDEYIAAFPEDLQSRMRALRAVIRETAPGAEESISYTMPTFKLYGPVAYFGAYRKHIGFYPAPRENAAFKAELAAYGGAKGTLQLPHDQPLPLDLIRRIVRFRVEKNLEAAEAK